MNTDDEIEEQVEKLKLNQKSAKDIDVIVAEDDDEGKEELTFHPNVESTRVGSQQFNQNTPKYKCELCAVEYSRLEKLLQHQKLVHDFTEKKIKASRAAAAAVAAAAKESETEEAEYFDQKRIVAHRKASASPVEKKRAGRKRRESSKISAAAAADESENVDVEIEKEDGKPSVEATSSASFRDLILQADESVICAFCGKTFPSKSDGKKHIYKKHKMARRPSSKIMETVVDSNITNDSSNIVGDQEQDDQENDKNSKSFGKISKSLFKPKKVSYSV